MAAKESAGYKLYINKVLMPVAPSSINIKINNQNSTLKLINKGELNLVNFPGLTDFSFKLLLPNTKYPFAQYEKGFKRASYFMLMFEKLKTERTVFDFVVLRTEKQKMNTSTKVTFESYSISDDSEGNGDMIVDIDLKQYIAYGTKVVTIKKNTATTDTDRDTSTKPTTSGTKYTIKSGDTLPSIARAKLGDSNRCKEIYKINKKLLDDIAKSRGFGSEAGDWWIFPDTVIIIP